MANVATRATMRDRARYAADMVNSTFVTDAEFNAWLDVGMSKVHDIMVNKFVDYFESTSSISTVAGTADYNLPSDFYKEVGVDITSGGVTTSLRNFMNRERNFRNSLSAPRASAYRYRIVGSKIRFSPTPNSVEAVTLRYAPQYVPFAADGTVVHAAVPQGWEEYGVLHAAIQALSKSKSWEAVAARQAEMKDLEMKVNVFAEERDAGEPAKVVDITRRFSAYDDGDYIDI